MTEPYYCRHKIVRLESSGEHRCVTCQKFFDIVDRDELAEMQRRLKSNQWASLLKRSAKPLSWGAACGLLFALTYVVVGPRKGIEYVDRVEYVETIKEVPGACTSPRQDLLTPEQCENLTDKVIEKYILEANFKCPAPAPCPDLQPCPQMRCPKTPYIPKCPACPKCPDVNVEQAQCDAEADCSDEIRAACQKYIDGVQWFIEKGQIPKSNGYGLEFEDDDYDQPFEDE